MRIVATVIGVLMNCVVTAQYQTGMSFDDASYAAVPVTSPLSRGDFDNLPASVSLQQFAPTPGNQGQTGTCVAWSSAYHARTILESIRMNRIDIRQINANVYAPSFVYNQIRKEPGCDRGTFIHEALELMSAKGVPKYSEMPFDCNRQIGENDLALASSHRIQGYKILFNINDNNKILPVKKSLSEHKPVLIGMMVPESFFGPKGVWQPKQEEFVKSHPGHAMVTIGYDDNAYGGSFLVMNSWGTTWGNQGFIWIKYNDFAHFVKYAFEIIERLPEEKSFVGGLVLKKTDGSNMNVKKVSEGFYKTTSSYSSGTAFRIYINNERPAYIYAIGSDLTKTCYQIFPHKPNISPYLGYKQSNVPIPDENHYVRMDQQSGKDYLCVLYSSVQLDPSVIMRELQSASGNTFMERLQNSLGSKLKTDGAIRFDGSAASFEGKFSGEGIVPIVIEIDHL
ncbi:MAG TPA: C1 family peptidase [Ohtaekwangia sp.]|nr:C1 family peptidase [Ohtaekwangia sp.]